MPRAARGRAFLGASGLLLWGLACAQILNVDGIQIVSSEPDAPPGETRVCQALDLHCEGAALQICRDDGSGFRTARVCSSPQLCCDDPSVCPDALGCQVPACSPGDFQCDGSLLRICNDGQTGWTPVSTCPTAAQCNASLGRCSDQPCSTATPDRQCSDGALLECRATGWTALESCSTSALCSTAQPSPGCQPTGCMDERGPNAARVPSPFRCENGDLQRCNDQQTGFEFVETCLNAVHCSDLRDSVVGDPSAARLGLELLADLGCRQPECTPGRYRCNGSSLERCNPNRTGYIQVELCSTPGRCNASAGRCAERDCAAGETQCSGADFQICSATGSWETSATCLGAAQCDPGTGCKPAVCEVTQYRCNGSALERCNVEGTDWIPIHACESAELCNAAAKRCDAPLCNAGELRCSWSGTLDRCSPGRNSWQTLRNCREEALLPASASPEQISATCDPSGEGRCNSPPGCVTGSLRCNSQYLERCQNGGWQPLERCVTSSACDASGSGSCRAPSCTPGSHRCVRLGSPTVVAEPGDPTRGLTLQVCDAALGDFINVRDCAGDSYCDARHGQCDLCQPLRPLCFGSSLFLCSADGQERELERTCAQGCVPPTLDADGTSAGQPTCREDLP